MDGLAPAAEAHRSALPTLSAKPEPEEYGPADPHALFFGEKLKILSMNGNSERDKLHYLCTKVLYIRLCLLEKLIVTVN